MLGGQQETATYIAAAAVFAGVAVALVGLDLAVVTAEPGPAGAGVCVDLVEAGASVLARVRQALVKLEIAVRPGVAGPAEALVPTLPQPSLNRSFRTFQLLLILHPTKPHYYEEIH